MDDNEKDLKNGEHLLEWLCCCKWLQLTGELFESLFYLSICYSEEKSPPRKHLR